MAEAPQITRILIFRNGLFSAAAWLFPIILGLIATPVIIAGLGLDAYGVFAIITGFVSYSFTFGIGRSAVKYVAELRSSGQIERMSAALSAVIFISLVVGLFVVVLVGLTANWLVSDVLIIPHTSHFVATNALYVASMTILITMVSQVFQFILQGLHRFDRFLLLTNLGGLLLTIGNVTLVLTGFGVLALVVWNGMLVLINCLLFIFATRRVLPEFSLMIRIESDVWRDVSIYAVSIVGYQIFGNALLLFERGWITRKFGTEALTYYVVPMALGFYFHGLIASLVVVLFPVVSQLLGEREKLIRLYRTSTKAVLALTALFLITMIFGGSGFLQVWLDSHFASASYGILVIHAFTFAVIAMTTIAWQLTEAFGMARANAFAGAVWFLISTPLMVVLSGTWQTEGVAAARLIGVFAFIPLIAFVERRFLGGPPLSFWPTITFKVLAAATAAGAAEYLIGQALRPGWMSLVFMVMAGTAVYFCVLLIAGYIESDEKAVFMELAAAFRKPVRS